MRIFLTGDTHGNACGEMRLLNAENFEVGKTLTEDDILIVLGDFGLIFDPIMSAEEFYWLKWLADKPWTTCFIDGNHENFDRINSLPETVKWGGKVGVVDFANEKGSKMSKPLYHLKRGQVFDFG